MRQRRAPARRPRSARAMRVTAVIIPSARSAAAEQALRRREQDHDEQREHGDRGEDAADQEVRGLLEQAEREPADDRAAVVAEPAERDRHEAVEVQQRAVGEEGEQQLRRRKIRRRRR